MPEFTAEQYEFLLNRWQHEREYQDPERAGRVAEDADVHPEPPGLQRELEQIYETMRSQGLLPHDLFPAAPGGGCPPSTPPPDLLPVDELPGIDLHLGGNPSTSTGDDLPGPDLHFGETVDGTEYPPIDLHFGESAAPAAGELPSPDLGFGGDGGRPGPRWPVWGWVLGGILGLGLVVGGVLVLGGGDDAPSSAKASATAAAVREARDEAIAPTTAAAAVTAAPPESAPPTLAVLQWMSEVAASAYMCGPATLQVTFRLVDPAAAGDLAGQSGLIVAHGPGVEGQQTEAQVVDGALTASFGVTVGEGSEFTFDLARVGPQPVEGVFAGYGASGC